ncbi:hypothetical protein Tco_0707184 [Tanacetum coccineum]|uniref:Uncharacterized protein n=1 Tax=Tanacetum coccineum TaxID=301880 RepID=A0ABQ4YBP5_9ASTR
MEIYTKSKPKETHLLQKSGIASLAIRVPKSNPTVKKGHPMIGLNEWLRSKAQGEREGLIGPHQLVLNKLELVDLSPFEHTSLFS